MRRISPVCPKCQSQMTYDVIPELPNSPEIQLSHEFVSNEFPSMTVGNAKYHCVECGHTWKKYRGKKHYQRIKKIEAYAGGYPGPFFNVKIKLDTRRMETEQWEMSRDSPIHDSNFLTDEEIEWFRSELYKCDFLNWAEEYILHAMDGTHWSVRIEFDTYCEMKTGSNHFPAKWTKFCKTLSKIAKSDFY